MPDSKKWSQIFETDLDFRSCPCFASWLQCRTYSYMCNTPSCCGCSGRRPRGTSPWTTARRRGGRTGLPSAPSSNQTIFVSSRKFFFSTDAVFSLFRAKIENFFWKTLYERRRESAPWRWTKQKNYISLCSKRRPFLWPTKGNKSGQLGLEEEKKKSSVFQTVPEGCCPLMKRLVVVLW